MKYFKNLNSLRTILLSICLVVFAMTLIGCGGTQSETAAERGRRWRMVSRSGLGQINDDIDALLMMDKRSKLTENVIRDY
jgi:hypothetical protein